MEPLRIRDATRENAALADRQDRVIAELEQMIPMLFGSWTEVAERLHIHRNRLYRFRSPSRYLDHQVRVGRASMIFILERLEALVDGHRWHLIKWPLAAPPDFDEIDADYAWYWPKRERLRALLDLSRSPADTESGLKLVGELCTDALIGPAAYRCPLAVTALLSLASLLSYPRNTARVAPELLRRRIQDARALRAAAHRHAGEGFDPELRGRNPRKSNGYCGSVLTHAGARLRDDEVVREGFLLMVDAARDLRRNGQRLPPRHPEGHWFNVTLAAERLAPGGEFAMVGSVAEALLHEFATLVRQDGDEHLRYEFLVGEAEFPHLMSWLLREAPDAARFLRDSHVGDAP